MKLKHWPLLTLLLVALTGYAKDQERLDAAGFDEHLLKPPILELLRRLFIQSRHVDHKPSS